MDVPLFDRQDQYDLIASYCLPDENIYAVFNCPNARIYFFGLTDKRIIFPDKFYFVVKDSLVSIPYHQIDGIATLFPDPTFQVDDLSVLVGEARINFKIHDKEKAKIAYQYIMSRLLNLSTPG